VATVAPKGNGRKISESIEEYDAKIIGA